MNVKIVTFSQVRFLRAQECTFQYIPAVEPESQLAILRESWHLNEFGHSKETDRVFFLQRNAREYKYSYV